MRKIVKIRIALKGLLAIVVDQPDGFLQIGLPVCFCPS